jgi:hypothetical protein
MSNWTYDVADAFIEEPNPKAVLVEDSVQMYLREIGEDPLLNVTPRRRTSQAYRSWGVCP